MRDLESLLAHNHPIEVRFVGKNMKLCSRCTGVISGFVIFTIITSFHSPSVFLSLSVIHQIAMCLFLAMPTAADWLTQKCGLRESTNTIRLFTGFLEGVAVSLLVLTPLLPLSKILLVIATSGGVITLGLALRRCANRSPRLI